MTKKQEHAGELERLQTSQETLEKLVEDVKDRAAGKARYERLGVKGSRVRGKG